MIGAYPVRRRCRIHRFTRRVHYKLDRYVLTSLEYKAPKNARTIRRGSGNAIVAILMLAANDVNRSFEIFQDRSHFIRRNGKFVAPLGTVDDHLIAFFALPDLDGGKRAELFRAP